MIGSSNNAHIEEYTPEAMQTRQRRFLKSQSDENIDNSEHAIIVGEIGEVEKGCAHLSTTWYIHPQVNPYRIYAKQKRRTRYKQTNYT